jgi:hypothetical protein
MEEAFSLWIENINQKHIPGGGNVLQHKVQGFCSVQFQASSGTPRQMWGGETTIQPYLLQHYFEQKKIKVT